MRVVGDLRLAASGTISHLDWVRANRLLVLLRTDDVNAVVLTVDPARRRIVASTPLDGVPYDAASFGSGFVSLLGPQVAPGPDLLAIVDSGGAVHTTLLDGLSASAGLGLAVDSGAGRAFIVDSDFNVAAVDLHAYTVAYHAQSLRWLAKGLPAGTRVARWIGNGLLAVAGTNSASVSAPPAGLRVIDTRTWGSRLIDPAIATFQVGAGLLIGTGDAFEENVAHHYSAYGADGTLRYGVDVPAGQSLVVQGRYAYVCHGRGLLGVLNAATGRVLHRYGGVTLPLCNTLLYGHSG
jgi:hypothetical protein